MSNTISAFYYYDNSNAKILVTHKKPHLNRPFSPVFGEVYQDDHADFVDQMVERANSDCLLSKVDALMTLAYFLEREWPIPNSLADYASKVIEKAVISFGNTEGGYSERNTAVCNALGLALPPNRPSKDETAIKQVLIHSYIWWRKFIYGETINQAVQHAENAFEGTGSLSRDAYLKMYKELEKRRREAGRHGSWASLELFVELKLYPDEFRDCIGNIAFNDDEFLRSISPFMISRYHPEDEIPPEMMRFIDELGLKDTWLLRSRGAASYARD